MTTPATSSLVLTTSRIQVVGILTEQQGLADIRAVVRMLASAEQRHTAVQLMRRRVGHQSQPTASPAPQSGV